MWVSDLCECVPVRVRFAMCVQQFLMDGSMCTVFTGAGAAAESNE